MLGVTLPVCGLTVTVPRKETCRSLCPSTQECPSVREQLPEWRILAIIESERRPSRWPVANPDSTVAGDKTKKGNSL